MYQKNSIVQILSTIFLACEQFWKTISDFYHTQKIYLMLPVDIRNSTFIVKNDVSIKEKIMYLSLDCIFVDLSKYGNYCNSRYGFY
jgi:hypothetical protein